MTCGKRPGAASRVSWCGGKGWKLLTLRRSVAGAAELRVSGRCAAADGVPGLRRHGQCSADGG